MLRFLADENFDNDILRALRSQDASLDVLRVQDTGLGGFDDEALLAWTARNGRILLTHDVTTITAFAYARVVMELPMPGVIAVPEGVSIREAAENLALLANCSGDSEWEGQVVYLPLR